MRLAQDTGIDAFALNIGTDASTDTQLGYAYTSAAQNGMKLFLSFDFSYQGTSDGSAIGAKVKQYASYPAQLKVDGKIFVSTFTGDGVDVNAIEAAAGQSIFFASNFKPENNDFGNIQSAFNWMAWPNNGKNKAPTPGSHLSVGNGDQTYINALNGKPYIARESNGHKGVRWSADKMIDSRFSLVLHSLWKRSFLQQELGFPLRPALVQPLARGLDIQATLCGDYHLELTMANRTTLDRSLRLTQTMEHPSG